MSQTAPAIAEARLTSVVDATDGRAIECRVIMDTPFRLQCRSLHRPPADVVVICAWKSGGRRAWPRWLGNWAEVDACDDPVIVLPNRYLCHAKAAGSIAPLICALLRLRTYGNGGLAVEADLNIVPRERLVLQIARSPRAEVLFLGEHESKRPDKDEVVGEQWVQCFGVSPAFSLRPTLSEA
jgi:hypothetical protein